MRILVDHSAAVNQGAGIGRYARNLVPALMTAWSHPEYTLWYAPEGKSPPHFLEAARSVMPPGADVEWNAFRWSRRRADQLWFRARLPLPIQFFAGATDLVYSPDFTAPPAGRVPTVITVHDLAFDIVPDHAPDALRRYLSAVVPRQVKESAAVVAVSETTKRDLIDRMDVPSGKIFVVTNAADARFFEAEPLTFEERNALGIPERYLLTVGTLEPRKNHLNLFHAMEELPRNFDVPLVIAGRIGWNAEAILDQGKTLQTSGRVFFSTTCQTNCYLGSMLEHRHLSIHHGTRGSVCR